MKFCAAQINPIVGDIDYNTQRILDCIEHAKQQQLDCIIFPELSLCGYPPEDLLFRPDFHKRCDKSLATITAAADTIAVIIGHPHTQDGTHSNHLSMLYQQSVIASYSKQELPNYTVFDEKRYFSPGQSNTLVDFKGLKIGLLICEDLWHDDISDTYKNQGAELLICINASPFAKGKMQQRLQVARQRLQQTALPLIYVNCVGGQDELVFDGASFAMNPNGECRQAAGFEEELLMIDFDHSNKHFNNTQAPIKAKDLENIYQALVLGVKDYINKNGFPGAIIGLSGGIDSALTLAIAYDALGAERLHVLTLPSQYTADISNDDAKRMADTLEVKEDCISIEPLFQAFKEALQPVFNGSKEDTTEENLQARIRGTLLMALSNKSGAIVLTTGNRSEMSVGYCTLYGDMAGGFAVLKDIPKTLVYELARYRNSVSPIIPERIMTRPPSAELKPNQCDQDSLPDYDCLDAIIELYIDQELDADPITKKGFDKATVEHVISLIKRNEYKRRQAPIGIRISAHAFGKDRRYPITSGY